ncbi:hypothetical protein TNCV_2564471 [Trichonephila clavipes]|nr:hypothetical protein TNCV_2564471 [Trichonephila clavipes]
MVKRRGRLLNWHTLSKLPHHADDRFNVHQLFHTVAPGLEHKTRVQGSSSPQQTISHECGVQVAAKSGVRSRTPLQKSVNLPESACLVNENDNEEKPDESEKSDVLQKNKEIPVTSKWPDIETDSFITNGTIQKLKSNTLENTGKLYHDRDEIYFTNL